MNKSRLALFVYSLVCNIPVCLALSVTATIVASSKVVDGFLIIDFNNWNGLYFLYNFLLGLLVAVIDCNFIPMAKIGKWFTGLCHVRNDTYKGNMPYRLLAGIPMTLIYYITINPTLLLLNYLLGCYPTARDAGLFFITNMPFMIIVGYITATISDFFAFRVARAIDPNF